MTESLRSKNPQILKKRDKFLTMGKNMTTMNGEFIEIKN